MEAQFEEGTTLDRFLMESMQHYPGATGQFVNLMQSVALAGKMISSRVNRAGLAGMLGGTGEVNIQGEFVQKLDNYANETFVRSLEHRGHTAMVVSEEEAEPADAIYATAAPTAHLLGADFQEDKAGALGAAQRQGARGGRRAARGVQLSRPHWA